MLDPQHLTSGKIHKCRSSLLPIFDPEDGSETFLRNIGSCRTTRHYIPEDGNNFQKCRSSSLIIFDPEDGGDIFLRKVASHTDYTAVYPRKRQHSEILEQFLTIHNHHDAHHGLCDFVHTEIIFVPPSSYRKICL
jgi:hypothetical protein